MPNFGKWVTADRAPNYLKDRSTVLAALVWRTIQEKPSTITIYRQGIAKSPQVVRVETSNYGSFSEMFPGGEVGDQDIWIVGVLNHPTIDDIDIQRGDMFVYDNKTFEVNDTITYNLGWKKAICEVTD